MKTIKLIGKLAFTALALWFFSQIGLMTITGRHFIADPFLNDLLVLFILSIIIWLGMLTARTLYMVFIFMTFGIGLLLLPVVLSGMGFFMFWFIQEALPNWIFLHTGFLGTLLMSFVLCIIWFSRNDEDD